MAWSRVRVLDSQPLHLRADVLPSFGTRADGSMKARFTIILTIHFKEIADPNLILSLYGNEARHPDLTFQCQHHFGCSHASGAKPL